MNIVATSQITIVDLNDSVFVPNLLPWSTDWVAGSGSLERWTAHGDAAENVRSLFLDPFGYKNILWRCIPDADGGASGGFTIGGIRLNREKTYRFTCFIKRSSTIGGTLTIGMGNVNTLAGVSVSNAPFISFMTGPQADRWYLLVGILHPAGTTSSIGKTGIYDMRGTKLTEGVEYAFGVTPEPTFYVKLDGATTSSSEVQLFMPTLECLDGTEESIQTLIRYDGSENDYLRANIEWDADNNAIRINGNFYATGSNSALGVGTGGGGGTSYNMVQDWSQYVAGSELWVVSAELINALRTSVTGHIGDSTHASSGEKSNWNAAYSHSLVTGGVHMTFTDRSKLDGIEAQANKYIHPTKTSRSAGGASHFITAFTSDTLGHVTGITTAAMAKADVEAVLVGNTITSHYHDDRYFKKDELFTKEGSGTEADPYRIKANFPFYGVSSVAALGIGVGGGGTAYDRLDTWASYDITKAGWVLSAALGYDLHDRVSTLESSTPNVAWGVAGSVYIPLAVNGVSHQLSTYGHTHTKSSITDFAHTHDDRYYTETEVNTLLANSSNWNTAYGWGNHASAGYAANSSLTSHTGNTSNPHAVTASQLGLGSVNNTADSEKNVLSATKLTTARTLWGQSFDGTANVAGDIKEAVTVEAYSFLSRRAMYNMPANGAGWYRIATYEPTNGDQSMNAILMVDTGYNSAFPETHKVLVSAVYNKPKISILESTGDNVIRLTKFRVTSYQVSTYTYRYAIDVYYTLNSAVSQILKVSGSIGSLVVQTPVLYTTFDTDGHILSTEIDTVNNATVLNKLKLADTVSATTAILSNLTAGYIPYHTAGGLANSPITISGNDVSTAGNLTLSSADGTFMQIGGGRLVWDNTNNAIKVIKADGTAANFYATGSNTALGIGTGGGGSSYNMISNWSQYVAGSELWVVSAELINALRTSVTGHIGDSTHATAGEKSNWNAAYSHSLVTGGVHMTFTDRSKLDGIEAQANKYVHPNSGVTAGTYRSVTVNVAGHVTGGTNPTSLSGYGITDAMSTSHAANGITLTDRTNWGTAYGWGNHASAGYLTAITKAQVEGVLTGGITSHTHSYLPLAGGTMSNTTLVPNLNADLLDGVHGSDYGRQLPYNQWYNSLNSILADQKGFLDNTYTNKLEFYPINLMLVETSIDGGSWSTSTEYTDSQLKNLTGGDINAGLSIPNLGVNGTGYKRITFTRRSYVYMDTLYIWSTTVSGTLEVKVEKENYNTKVWEVIKDWSAIPGWPSHHTLKHANIEFNAAANQFEKVRITFRGTTTNGTYLNHSIDKIQWWGPYPSGKRNIYATDGDKNVVFPAILAATAFKEGSTLLSDKYAAIGQTHYVGTTAIAANRASAAQALTGITSIDGSAAKLTTTRALTIGATAKNFDGSAAVSWSLAEIGAMSASATTDSVNEGTTNYYFTASRVLGVNLSTVTPANTALAANIPISTAMNRIQGQINARALLAGASTQDFATKNLSVTGTVTATDAIKGSKLYSGYNYTTQTAGFGFGTDGLNNGAVFYTGADTSGRIYRDGDVMYFVRGISATGGFSMNSVGAVTFNQAVETKALLTATGNIATANVDGAYLQLGPIKILYDATNGAIRVEGNVYATGSNTAFGIGGGAGGGGLITNVYSSSGFGGSYSDVDLSSTFNAYAINSLYTSLQGKQNTITGAISNLVSSNLYPNNALVSGATGKIYASGVTATELSYLSGASSNIQTQLNAKPSINSYPTAFSWSAGSTSGPTGTLSGSNMTAVSFGAIPEASMTASGIVTTGSQTFAGEKSFANSVWLAGANALILDGASQSIYSHEQGEAVVTYNNDTAVTTHHWKNIFEGLLEVKTGNALTSDIVAQPAGTIQFANGATANEVPAIIGKSSSASTGTGLTLSAATANTNAIGDMTFGVRQNNNTDYTDFTKDAFKWSRYGTTLMTLKRNGLFTLMPAANTFQGQGQVPGTHEFSVAGDNMAIYSTRRTTDGYGVMLTTMTINNNTSGADMRFNVREQSNADFNASYLSNVAFRWDRYTTALMSLTRGGKLTANEYAVSALAPAPSSASAAGTAGDIRFTGVGIFICIATNTWRKATISTF